MAKSSWGHALVWVSLAGALAGCSTAPDNQRPVSPLVDAATAGSELVPRAEPPSRSGNPDTYVVFGRRYRVRETSAGYRERGIASWYGWDFHGRKTSSGPPFNMFDLTAAHKSLPLPTYVRVTNLDNGRNTVVKVTDRGPFVGTRLIDLSYAAADRLGMLEQGTAPVEVVALEPYQTLSDLAARRAEKRELLARRAQQMKPKVEAAEIEFAHATPIRPLARAQAPIQSPVRLAQAEEERGASKAVAKPPIRLAQAEERSAPKAVAKTANVKLALADVEPSAPKAVARAASVKPVLVEERSAPKAVARTANVKLALADVERSTPKAVAKAPNVKPAKVEDDRNPIRAGGRQLSTVPKGKEAVAKPLPAPNANRNGKPVPARQASASGPMAVRLASVKPNRSRGVAD